jgi:hypothetical protein
MLKKQQGPGGIQIIRRRHSPDVEFKQILSYHHAKYRTSLHISSFTRTTEDRESVDSQGAMTEVSRTEAQLGKSECT